MQDSPRCCLPGRLLCLPGDSRISLLLLVRLVHLWLTSLWDVAVSIWVSGMECLLLCAHALLGHQQNYCREDKDAAYYVEDCGADAAGGGKEGTGGIFYIKLENT